MFLSLRHIKKTKPHVQAFLRVVEQKDENKPGLTWLDTIFILMKYSQETILAVPHSLMFLLSPHKDFTT